VGQDAASDPRLAATLPIGVTSERSLGRFRILRPHAKGGLGQVSVALDQELNREVALKEIQPRHADDQVSRERFVLEAEITGGLEHPGIVPVYALGQGPDGRPFYAMRFVKGDSLKDAIERFHNVEVAERDPGEQSVAFRELLGRFVDVCNAVAYAHSRGVLHRDLKPSNVMLGKYGETLLVDWGLAKSVDRPEVKVTDRPTLVRVDPRKMPDRDSTVYLRIREGEHHPQQKREKHHHRFDGQQHQRADRIVDIEQSDQGGLVTSVSSRTLRSNNANTNLRG
jgi:serine/threonine protein kinase